MRVLYFTQYFYPEVGATQARAYEMARGLVEAGHEVTVIAEVPNHPHGIIPPEYQRTLYQRSTLDGIEVIRVWVKASPKKLFVHRMAFYLSYMIMAFLAGILLARKKYDAIYATSPPLFVGGAALGISLLRRIPLFFEVRDLWPESAVALGELTNRRAIKMATWLEERCYARARRVIVVTRGTKVRLVERGIRAGAIALIPNGANTDLYRPLNEAGAALKERLRLENRFIVLYAGIHGIAQGLETVLACAAELEMTTGVHFLFVGEGPVKAALMEEAASLGLQNVTFHSQVPRDEVPAFLSMADIALVPLRNVSLFEGVVPSKMYDAWACACPTLTTVPGEARQVLEEAGAGVFVPPEDAAKMAQAIGELAEDPQRCRVMGRRGRVYVEANYSRRVQARQLVELLEKEINT